MIYLLTPLDIPQLWEPIKKAVKAAETVQEKDLSSYLTILLHDLLSAEAICFARFDSEGTLEAIAIASILLNKTTHEKYLYIQTLFSWQIVSEEVWRRDIEFIKKVAINRECSYIGCQSSNPRAWKIYDMIGMVEETRIFSLRV